MTVMHEAEGAVQGGELEGKYEMHGLPSSRAPATEYRDEDEAEDAVEDGDGSASDFGQGENRLGVVLLWLFHADHLVNPHVKSPYFLAFCNRQNLGIIAVCKYQTTEQKIERKTLEEKSNLLKASHAGCSFLVSDALTA